MTTKKDVKRSTVDEMTRRIVQNTPGMTVDRAKATAVESAERVNRERKGDR